MSALAERYAEASWRLAKTPEQGDALVQEIVAFLALLDGSKPLAQALANPSLRSRAKPIIEAVVAAGGGSDLLARLLVWLHRQGRLALLYDIGWALARRVDRAANRLRAHVTTAVALSAAQRAEIERVLSARFGKPVVADVAIDRTLQGGLVCRIGRITFDSSLKRQFAQFAERSRGRAL